MARGGSNGNRMVVSVRTTPKRTRGSLTEHSSIGHMARPTLYPDFLIGHVALSTLHPDDHGIGVRSTLPCPDVLSRPNASVLDKSLDYVSQAIIIHTTKSKLDGTLLGHFKQTITTCTAPPAKRKTRMTVSHPSHNI